MNSEFYKDPTAEAAVNSVYEEGRRMATVIHIIKLVCQLAGFRIVERIVLQDVKSKTTYR